MEEIKNVLMVIARKLNANFKIISNSDLESITFLIEKANILELSKIALRFLDLVLKNNCYTFYKNYFNKMYNLFYVECEKHSEKRDYILRLLKFFKTKNYFIFLEGLYDGRLSSIGILPDKVKLYVPESEAEVILGELYGLGASIYESNVLNVGASYSFVSETSDAIAVLSDDFSVELSFYVLDKDNNMKIRKYIKQDGKIEIEEIVFAGEVDVYKFQAYDKRCSNIKMCTIEWMYENCIQGSTPYCFILAMNLKDKINYKKSNFMRNFLKVGKQPSKEENKNGLQKIS